MCEKGMKRYTNLYSEITDIENIKLAIYKASKDKRDRKSVQKILENSDYYAKEIHDMLINHSYVPSHYKVAKIYDGARKKERIIKKPRFYPDQCIHWSLMLVVEKLFQKRFYQFNCSSIKGRGTHYAKNYLKGALRDTEGTKYAYQLDIRKFYPSCDNEILKKKLERMFKDKDVLWLFGVIIDSDKGLPIGNYTSQWLANFYLTDLDFYIKQKLNIKYCCRYADNIIVFDSNKRRLQHNRKLIEDFLHSDKLEIKDDWQVYKVDARPIDFLGFKFYRDRIVLRSSLYMRIKRRAKKIGKKGYLNLKDARALTSYWGYINSTDCHSFYMKDIKPYVDINKCRKVISNETKKQYSNQIKF